MQPPGTLSRSGQAISGNCYVLTADGTAGFAKTMSDPGKPARQADPGLLSFMTGLPADDQPS